MSDYYDTFTFTCPHCGETTQVVEGLEIGHGCPPAPAVEVSGCADIERARCPVCRLSRLPLDDQGRLAAHTHPRRLARCAGTGREPEGAAEPTTTRGHR